MTVRRAVLAGLSAAGLVAWGGAVARTRAELPRALNDPDLLRFVELMALTREGRDGVRRPGWVRRWTRGIEVDVEGADRAPHGGVLSRTS